MPHVSPGPSPEILAASGIDIRAAAYAPGAQVEELTIRHPSRVTVKISGDKEFIFRQLDNGVIHRTDSIYLSSF